MGRSKATFKDLESKYGTRINIKYLEYVLKDEKKYGELNDRILANYYLKYAEQEITPKISEIILKEMDDEIEKTLREAYSQGLIDEEAYVFFAYKTLLDDDKEMEEPEIASNCKKYLQGSNYRFFYVNPESLEIERTTAQELIGKVTPDKFNNAARLDKIQSLLKELNCSIAILFSALSLQELGLFCKNEQFEKYLTILTSIDIAELSKECTLEEKLNYLNGERLEELDKGVNVFFEYLKKHPDSSKKTLCYETIKKYFQKYPSEFDLDRFLLIATDKIRDTLEKNKIDDNLNKKLSRLLKICFESIVNKETRISAKSEYCAYLDNLSYSEIEKCCRRITKNGYYVSKNEEEAIKSQLLDTSQESSSVAEQDPDKLAVISFKDEEYEQIAKKEGSIAFLLRNKILPKKIYNRLYQNGEISQADMRDLMTENIVTDKEAKNYLSQLDTIDQETFELLCDRQMLSAKEIFDMFMKEKISFEAIDGMQTEEKQEIAQMLSVEKLAELYRKSQEEIAEEKTEGKYTKEYLQYIQLYRNLIRKDKNQEEKRELDEELLEAFDLNLENEDFEYLYNSHLLLIDTLREYVNDKFLEKMMKKTKIRPADARTMCLNDDLELLYRVLRDENISKTRKMAISRTTFANIYDNDLTEEERQRIEQEEQECWRLIGFKNKKEYLRNIGENEEENEEDNNGNNNGHNSHNRYNKWVFNLSLRWDLIDLMGSHSYEVLDSGLIIYKFPDYKGGRILLEKMYKNDRPNYGRATKIIDMPIEEFEKIKNEIIIGEDIYPSVIDSRPEFEGKVTTISHTRKWPTQLADYFEARTQGQRTPEEIGRVNQKIERVLDSRSILE